MSEAATTCNKTYRSNITPEFSEVQSRNPPYFSLLRSSRGVGVISKQLVARVTLSYGKNGYIALYSHEAKDDAVLILAIRHQREFDYSEGR